MLLNIFHQEVAILRNKRKLAAVCSCFKGSTRTSWEQSVTETVRSWNYWELHHTKFGGKWRKGYQKTIPGIQQDRLQHFGCSVSLRQLYIESTCTGLLWNRSENIPEQWRWNPKIKRGSFPELLPSRSGVLCLAVVEQFNWLRPGKHFSQYIVS